MSDIYEKFYGGENEVSLFRGQSCNTVNCKDMKEYDEQKQIVHYLCRRPVFNAVHK